MMHNNDDEVRMLMMNNENDENVIERIEMNIAAAQTPPTHYTVNHKRKILNNDGNEYQRPNKRFKSQSIPVMEITQINNDGLNVDISGSDDNLSLEDLQEQNLEDCDEDLNMEAFHAMDAHDLDSEQKEKLVEMEPIDTTSIDYFIDLYQLPEVCKELYHGYRNIKNLYQWQQEVLTTMIQSQQSSNCMKSLLYSLSTSAGKTLISEFLLLYTCHVQQRNAMLILPYVSLVEEKKAHLEIFADFANFHVESYFANKGTWPVPSLIQGESAYVFVATIEKANTILNELIENNRLEELGCIVIDELHMIGDERVANSNVTLATKSRGILLESCLSKINYYNRGITPGKQQKQVQIVGMSATIPNLEALACDWLGAEKYISTFRPVPLKEYYKIGTKIFDGQQNVIRDLKSNTQSLIPRDKDHLVQLCLEIIPEFSVIVFCSTKKGCEQCMSHMISLFPPTIAQQLRDYKSEEKQELINNLELLWNTQQGVIANRQNIIKGIQHGIIFHHSGLSSEERLLIESAFQARTLSVICATSTLAAGVNLPARRVIFRTPYIAQNFLTVARYKQMAGRAGRAGIDEFGESFLLLAPSNQEEQKKGIELINKPLDNCVSQFFVDSPLQDNTENQENIWSVAKLALDAFCSGLCDNREDLKQLAKSTLFWNVNAKGNVQLQDRFLKAFDSGVQFLVDNKLAGENALFKKDCSQNNNADQVVTSTSTAEPVDTPKPRQPELTITPFGLATYKSSFTIEEAAFVSSQLIQSRDEGIIFSDELHICFLLTPVGNGVLLEPNWTILLNIYNKLSTIRQRICKNIGIQEAVIFEKAYSRGSKEPNSIEAHQKELVVKRFYNALILCDIINEEPIPDVCQRYGVSNPGDIQNLMQQASMFANMMRSFCSNMSWWTFESIIQKYVDRLAYGVQIDLLDLVQIEGVGATLARILYNLNIKVPIDLIQHTAKDLLTMITQHVNNNYEQEEVKRTMLISLGTDPQERMKAIVNDAKRILNKKAAHYKKLANEYDQHPEEYEDYSDNDEVVMFEDNDF
jgi:POLQ-like helicase